MNIEKQTYIKRDRLDEVAYFEALLENAFELKLITEKDVERLQDECLLLLAKGLRRTYGDMSDSVTEECAKNMMDSIIYTLGVGSKTFNDPDEALFFLLKNDIDTLYFRGMKRINEMLSGIKDMLNVLQNSLSQNADDKLIYTVTKTLPTFLKKYDPDIAAHDRIVLPVYPVDHYFEKYNGIEYIFAYTASLLKETEKQA